MTRAGASRYASVAWGVAWRNLRMSFSNPALLVPPIVAPLIFFATFAGAFGSIAQAPGFGFPSGYTSFQFVFVLMQAAGFNGIFMGFTTARDFESGFARRLLLAAPNRTPIVAGFALAALLRTAISLVVLFAAGFIGGMQVDGNLADVLGLVGLALGLSAAMTFWGTGLAMRFRTMQAAPLMQIPFFLGLFLAPTFAPAALLAGWIKGVAEVNPVTFLLEAGRGLISGTSAEILETVAVLAVMIAVLALWAVTGLRKAEEAG